MNRVDRGFVGHAKFLFGGRKGRVPSEMLEDDMDEIRKGNNYVLKVFWPKESSTSEVDILETAKEFGRYIDLIRDHIPDMVCHLDPTWIGSSTKTIRQFLGVSTEGTRFLRIMVFRRLTPIDKLQEKQMLTAYLQCFFCRWPMTRPKCMAESLTQYRSLLLVEDGDPT